jgi:hypothetical protein
MPMIPASSTQRNLDFTGVTQLSFWYKIANIQSGTYTLAVYIGGSEIGRINCSADVTWTQYTAAVSYSGIKLLDVNFSGYDDTPHPALYLDDFEMFKQEWVSDSGSPVISTQPGRQGLGTATPGGMNAWGP